MGTEVRKLELSEEPTDEQLELVMNEVAKEARRASERVKAEHARRLKEIGELVRKERAALKAELGK